MGKKSRKSGHRRRLKKWNPNFQAVRREKQAEMDRNDKWLRMISPGPSFRVPRRDSQVD